MGEDVHMRQEPNFHIRILGQNDRSALHDLYMGNVERLKELGLHDASTPVEAQIQNVLAPEAGRELFGVFDEKKLIGVVLLRKSEGVDRAAQIGRLIDSQYQNKGVGTKALMRVMDEVKGRYDNLVAITRGDNVLARRSLERAGFTLRSDATDDVQNALYEWRRS